MALSAALLHIHHGQALAAAAVDDGRERLTVVSHQSNLIASGGGGFTNCGFHGPCFGDNFLYACDPHWRDYVLFHEYFHAEVGCGLGANHQTGWTALITRCLGIVGRIAPEE